MLADFPAFFPLYACFLRQKPLSAFDDAELRVVGLPLGADLHCQGSRGGAELGDVQAVMSLAGSMSP